MLRNREKKDLYFCNLDFRAPKGSSRRIEGRKRDDKGGLKSEKEIFSRFFEDLTITLKKYPLFVSLKKIFKTYNMQYIFRSKVINSTLNISQVCIQLHYNHIMDIACLYTMAWSIFQVDAVFLWSSPTSRDTLLIFFVFLFFIVQGPVYVQQSLKSGFFRESGVRCFIGAQSPFFPKGPVRVLRLVFRVCLSTPLVRP